MEQMNEKETSGLLDEKLSVDAWWEAYNEAIAREREQLSGEQECPRCGNEHGQWRGYRRKKHGASVHRRWCRACGHWFGVVSAGIVSSIEDGHVAVAMNSPVLGKEIMAHKVGPEV